MFGEEKSASGPTRSNRGGRGANCRGPEKVRRLQAEFGDKVRLDAAYGDSDGDREMLAIAEEAGLKVFQGTP